MQHLYLFLIFISLFLYGCNENDATTQQAVSFKISVDQLATSTDELSLQITLKDLNGNTLPTYERIVLERSGEKYKSTSIALANGRYTIEEFLILNQNQEVVYATPRKSSPLANNVSITVPFDLMVSEHNIEQMAVEVLNTGSKQAEEFGYAAEKFVGKNPLHLAVYVNEDGRSRLTDATLYIQSSDGESYLYDLSAKINAISFGGDVQKQYTLRVWKDGYELFTQPFIYEGVRQTLHGKPLEIVLVESSTEPSASITLQPGNDYFSMWIEVSEQGMIILDWGNGETESLIFDVDPENMTATGYFARDHSYTSSAPPIKLTGDIHLLTAMWLETPLSTIDLKQAPGLRGLSLYNCKIPSLDLSLNNKLQWLGFYGSGFDLLMLPQQHSISTIDVSTDGVWPSSAELDYIIDNIHANTVAANITNGFMTLTVNEISPQATEQITELQNSYQWYVAY
jgi:hypothetical protein